VISSGFVFVQCGDDACKTRMNFDAEGKPSATLMPPG